MMKAILEFMLPDDNAEHHVAMNGRRYRSALREVDTNIRNALKYASAGTDFHAELQMIRDMIRELVPDLDDDL